MNDQREEIKQILENELVIPSKSDYAFGPRLGPTPIGPDIRIEYRNKIWYVEVKRKADWNSISKLLLFRELEDKQATLVIAAKVIPSTVRDLGTRIGIKFVQLPSSLVLFEKQVRTHGKVTSNRAWKVIHGLISSNNRSIRNISSTEKVSYAWSYQIINDLILKGIIERNGNNVILKDRSALFNAIAWERPLNKLRIAEISTDFNSTIELAKTISESKYGDKLIFCGYIAASLHFGAGFRSDLIQGYLLEDSILEHLRSDYSSNQKNGIALNLYTPDRDVKRDAIKISNLLITSKEQTILDLAGLGYQSRDLLDVVVKQYGADR